MDKKISDILEIIIPTYNRANSLKKTLESLLCELSPVKDVCITVLDNCSTDNTQDIVQDLLSSHNNLLYIRNNRNVGVANLAKVFERASKKYVWAVCDNDNIDFSCWDDVAYGLYNDYDAIFTQCAEDDIADIFCRATFLPACIYKTSNIDFTVMSNIYDASSTLFPHMALFASLLNEKKSIFIPTIEKPIISVNMQNLSISSPVQFVYLRGMDIHKVPNSRKYIYWTIGYYRVSEYVLDKKLRLKILSGLKQFQKSSWHWFYYVIFNNRFIYDNYLYNYFTLFRFMNFKMFLKFAIVFIFTYIRYPYIRCNYNKYPLRERWLKYFSYTNEQKYINKLAKKYKNKKVILYGAGFILNLLFEKYDLSKLNIVAIADKKFDGSQIFNGYRTISPSAINSLDADVVIFSMYPYKFLIEKNILKLDKKYDSLVKRTFFNFY